MSKTADKAPWPLWIAPVIVFALSAAILTAVAALFPADTRVVSVFLLSVLTVALLVSAACPFGVSSLRRLLPAGSSAAGAFVVLLTLAPSASLPAFTVLITFALALAGLIDLLISLRTPPRVAGGVVVILAVLLMTTLFWGTQLRRTLGRDAGDVAIHALVHANPMLAMGDRAVADFNWATDGELMYAEITRMGEDFPFVHPAWWATSLIYLAAAAICWPLSWWIAHPPPRRDLV